MADNKILKIYEDLPPWSRGVVGVTAALGIGFIIYTTYTKIRDRINLQDAKKLSDVADSELKTLASKGVKPTLTQSQVEAMCLKLVEAMNGCGTDEKMIKQVFESLSNKADLLMLIKIFDVRYYTPCAADQPISYIKWQFNDKSFGGNLATWMSYDLSSSNISDINAILQKKKIDYKF